MSNEQIIGIPVPGAESPQGGESVERQVERTPGSQYCVFRTGRERYCLSVSEVEEVVEWSTMTRMPLAPPYLMGILNLRGVIIPVLDIAYREGRRSDGTPTHLVVAVWDGGSERGPLRVGL